MSAENIILQMNSITKIFPGVRALDDVSLNISGGKIHALVGENGAGKSTLMNILSGVYPAGSYTGSIFLDNSECHFRNISDSEKAGIALIHQELALIPYLSIAENMFLGHEMAVNGIINWNLTRQKAAEYLDMVGMKESVDTWITNLGVGKQQLVEIARALSKNCRILVLDEPTAALNDHDSQHLLQLLCSLKEQGITCILISHKLNEVLQVSDSITVLRDGKTVAHFINSSEVRENDLIRHMVGRDLSERFPMKENLIGEILFEVRNWNVFHPIHSERKLIDDVSLTVKKGEIVGIAGLIGAGRTELAMSIFGRSFGKNISGEVFKNGKSVDLSTISKSIDQGVIYLTEDRKNLGLILSRSILENVTLSNLKKVSKMSVINKHREIVEANEEIKRFRVKYSSIHQSIINLSGGNQQKVVLAKWMFSKPDVLILDEPTRGIDVGAKYEIYTIINELAAEGKGIIFISSEFNELLGICDRVYVLNEGKIKGEILSDEVKTISETDVMQLLV